MSKIIILIICAGLCAAAPQFIIHGSPTEPYQHPAVLINSAMESNLPNELKNDFYKNPHIAAGLAQESWFSRKESQVINRDTDKIPREKIYHILSNAGFVRRK